MAMQEKVCSDCGKTKAVSDFTAHKTAHDGYELRCKPCRRKRIAEDRATRAWTERQSERERLYPSPQYIYGLVDPTQAICAM